MLYLEFLPTSFALIRVHFGVPIDQDRKHHSNEGEPKDDAYNAVYGKKKNSGGHNQQHSTGKVERGSLPITARGSVEIPVQTTIYFSSVISAAFQTIFTKSVMMNLNGVATVQLPWSDVNVPFSQTFDGYPFISDAVSKIG